MSVVLYRHPAAMPDNIRRLIKAHGAAVIASNAGAATSALKAWAAGEVRPSVQNQKRLAKLYFATYPEEMESLREVLESDVKTAARLLENAISDRTSPKDESHKPARKNWLLAQIHLNELEQAIRAYKKQAPGPASVVDPEIADVYGTVDG